MFCGGLRAWQTRGVLIRIGRVLVCFVGLSGCVSGSRAGVPVVDGASAGPRSEGGQPARGEGVVPQAGSQKEALSSGAVLVVPVGPGGGGGEPEVHADSPLSGDALSRAGAAFAACPVEMSLLPAGVCIDRWEASLALVTTQGEEKPWSPFGSLVRAPSELQAVSRAGVVPQGYISGVRAEEACQNAGKRLCSSEEWQEACRGPERTTYPYGNRRQAHVCNDDGRGKHPVVDLTERLGLAPEQMWRDSMEHPMINQLPNTVRKTGERTSCTNAYGVYDMVGNLHEWVEDAAGTFRGGFYMDTRINGEGCLYATTAHNKRYHDYSTGFRCCKDALVAEEGRP